MDFEAPSFETVLFPELGDLPFFDKKPVDLKVDVGRQSVSSEMSEGPSPSPLPCNEMDSFGQYLLESGIILEEGVLQMVAADEPAVQEQEALSEVPSSPVSVSDLDCAPSPAPSAVAQRTRSSTRVRVAPVSPASEQEPLKRNKAAEQAKINREKKKAYIAQLEAENKALAEENKSLKQYRDHHQHKETSYLAEIEYLKSIIANQSSLSSLLHQLPDIKGVRLSASFSASRKRGTTDDHSYGAPLAKRGGGVETPLASTSQGGGPNGPRGLCLHVAGPDQVSVEFCRHCSAMSGQQDFDK